MTILDSRLMILVTASALALACGSPAGDPRDDHKQSAARETAGGTAKTDPCSVITFSSSEPFAANDFVFFAFDQPAGWVHQQASDGQRWHGFIHPPGAERVGIEYIITPSPMDPDVLADMRESTMTRLKTISYDGEEVVVYGRSFPETATANIGLVLPFDGEHYDAVLHFRGPKGCDVERVEAVRSLVVDTLAPSPSTTFEPRR